MNIKRLHPLFKIKNNQFKTFIIFYIFKFTLESIKNQKKKFTSLRPNMPINFRFRIFIFNLSKLFIDTSIQYYLTKTYAYKIDKYMKKIK